MRQPLRLGAIVMAACVLLVGAPAHAVDGGSAYYFLPGHPIIQNHRTTINGSPMYSHCTGGYAIAGTSGVFLLSALACSAKPGSGGVLGPVRGTDRQFGTVAHANSTSVLVSEIPPDDALQIVVDRLTGRMPARGWVEGYMPTHEQGLGVLVGKMGIGSGWTEGQITGWFNYNGYAAICTTAHTGPGDAGGPVWRWDEHGLRAVGVVVAYHPETGHGCYLPIQEVLASWGAWMPVYGRTVYVPGPGTIAPGLPQLDATGYLPPVLERFVP